MTAVVQAQVSAAGRARQAAVSAARGEVDRARTQVQSAVTRVRSTWQANPKYIEATAAVETARKDFDAARAKVVDRLRSSDSTYAALLKTQADAQSRLADEQEKTKASEPATTQAEDAAAVVPNLPAPSNNQVAAAQEKLNVKAKLRNLEDKAVADDPDAAKAQVKLNEAQQAAKVWQAQLDAALKSDPDYRAAYDQLTAARSRLVAAGATDTGYDTYGEPIYVR